MKTLTDLDKMPFGIHKNKVMSDVPAAYFHWLWQAGKKHDKYCPVHNYIKINLHALQKEHPDGIWD